MACPNAGDMFVSGDWFGAIQCWLTAGGDPTMSIVVPSMIYGTVLVGYFIVGSSPLIPVVVSIILAGVIFVSFPAGAMQIVIITMLTVLSIGGLVLTWRIGR